MAHKKRMLGALGFIGVGVLALGLAGCSGGGDDSGATGDAGGEGDLTTVGFVAVGPEGGWRNANEQAIKDAFSTFVNDEVDVILLTATEASGWEDSLKLAQEAEIPVILLDRGVDASDDLYVTRIAPDNVKVAGSVGDWAVQTYPEGANYYVLEGVPGLSVVNERNEGFDQAIDGKTGWNKIGAQTANWTADEGKSVIETVLKENPNLQFIFAQNDEMGIGAAAAVTAAGLVPGTDVKIATIDGTTPALEALAKGDLSFVAQYNPFFGDLAVDAVQKALAGEDVEKTIIVPGETFDSAEAGQAAIDAGKGF
jgi:simple sugar transport system substrate-binding protein